jgi:hypothetical protein
VKAKNKPLIDRFWDEPSASFGVSVDFNITAPKDKTQIFIFSPETALAAENLTRSDSFIFPAAEDIHLPYENMAVEIPMTTEIRALRHDVGEGMIRILRIGASLKVANKDLRTVMCTPYWEFEDGRIQQSAFSFIYGNSPKIIPRFLLYVANKKELIAEVGYLPDVGLAAAASKSKVPHDIFFEAMNSPEAKQHLQEAASELPLLLFACSMLLNCKSGVTKTKVNKQTPKVSGLGKRMRTLMSASEYTVMHITAIENVSTSNGDITTQHNIDAHYVRGHFKQRKKGVYWWNPFIRGTGEPRRRTGYIVKE